MILTIVLWLAAGAIFLFLGAVLWALWLQWRHPDWREQDAGADVAKNVD